MPRAWYSLLTLVLELCRGTSNHGTCGENVHGDPDTSKQNGNSLVPNVDRLVHSVRIATLSHAHVTLCDVLNVLLHVLLIKKAISELNSDKFWTHV